LLTDEECDELIEQAKASMIRSTVLSETDLSGKLDDRRTSSGTFLKKNSSELVTRIDERISKLINWPVKNSEAMQVLHYATGAEYQPHHDWFNPDRANIADILKRGGQRLATLIMYLNTPEAGGGTVFPNLKYEVAAQKGNALFFTYPNQNRRCLHGGAPVVKGEKWAATKWYRENEFI
jgi:prolyl 4-hydroxylase